MLVNVFNEFNPDDLFQTIDREGIVEMIGLQDDGSLGNSEDYYFVARILS